ncbi:LOW QUALITY PROTEIN: minor allergen Can f 2-like [Zalophus californianus]|uniref:LOW QUALITY PROTEIN: minor allergen Can f 2-like n=1 Tax=Zalophus californianus TaxID=9704 RepID=A0A6J2ENF7_ZALCA|nr:LOW QUALITY PROTEIN: minor allergen Can f 2-like [Zalophus californianus]
MQLLLLTVGLALVCGLQAQEDSEEEPQERLQELSGIWHPAALASNNSALIRPGRHFINTISMKDGNLHVETLRPQEGRCEKVSLTAFKTDTNNKFSLEIWGHNDFHLEEVQPKTYLILYMTNRYNDVTSLVANLMLRDPSTQKDFLQAFESVCEDLGLHKDQIVALDTDAGGLGEPQGPKVQGHCSDHLQESHGQPLAEPLPRASAPWLP